ncbi:hypothetical protein T1E_5414 [Pseudomonas putida DOT-T1E]|uniref:Uncharacterized protein n=1 Tax=Pseudomonas putida (strain DOT-T1E) TaxID=1196325 RepID=I7B7S7_PSEPT|nr:hypothetical protein T1E_5414 [Pseudomonas putida DOT-T1E]
MPVGKGRRAAGPPSSVSLAGIARLGDGGSGNAGPFPRQCFDHSVEYGCTPVENRLKAATINGLIPGLSQLVLQDEPPAVYFLRWAQGDRQDHAAGGRHSSVTAGREQGDPPLRKKE